MASPSNRDLFRHGTSTGTKLFAQVSEQLLDARHGLVLAEDGNGIDHRQGDVRAGHRHEDGPNAKRGLISISATSLASKPALMFSAVKSSTRARTSSVAAASAAGAVRRAA